MGATMLELVVVASSSILPERLRPRQYDWPGWRDPVLLIIIFAVIVLFTWWATKNDK